MGIFAARATKRLIESDLAPTGNWLKLPSDWPAVDRADLLTLAALHTLTQIDVEDATSTWAAAGGKVSTGEVAGKSLRSLLRVEGGVEGGCRFVLGAVDPVGGFAADWSLQATPEAAGVRLAVPSCRTREDALVNADLFAWVRSAHAQTLSDGPPLRLTDGPPRLDGLVESQALRAPTLFHDASPFADDYVMPLPSAFRDGVRIPVPATEREPLVTLLHACGLPVESGPGTDQGLCVVDLDGGRPGPAARLRLVGGLPGMDSDELVIELPQESELGRRRTFRATVCLLWRIADRGRVVCPQTVQTLVGFLEDCGVDRSDPDRQAVFRPTWNPDLPLGVVPLRPGTSLPVALCVRGHGDSLMDCLAAAQTWLVVRERTWTRGMRAASRQNNRVYSMRRPAFLTRDGNRLPYLRYAHTGVADVETVVLTSADKMWFWECVLRSSVGADGVRESVLLVDGLSQTDGLLGYGAELLRLLGAFARLVQSAEPAAEIRTITLEL